jgi:glycosyltransferase involved in cell wall biosynthesis
MTGSRPVRLLFFCGATAWGGAEILLGHLLAGLPDRFEPSLLGVDAAVLARIAARRPGTPWATLPPIRGRRDLAALWAHRQALARARADVVQFNLPVPFADPYTVLAARTLSHTPVIAVVHLPLATRRPRKVRLVRLGVRRLPVVVAVSARAARQVEQLLALPAGAVRAVPNGVPEPAPPRPVPVPPGRLVIGAVGRLDRQKGFDLLLRAVARLPAAHVVLVGDGPERPALERLAAELGIAGRVSLLGWSEDAPGYLRSFDVLAVPSRYEGLPLVLLEAMVAGVPVVATTVGGIPDAVRDEVSALLVPPDDVAALAAALRRLATEEPLRRRLAAAAREAGRSRFTVEAMARSYADLYDQLLRGAAARAQDGRHEES